MEIEARRWLAVLYKCPKCGNQTVQMMLTPTKAHRNRSFPCYRWDCNATYEIAERRYYTTFAIEASVSFTMIAGTLEKIGPFDVCQIVYPSIRRFRRWVEIRRVELAEQHRLYMEEWKKREAEGEVRRRKEAAERAFLWEVEAIAYRQDHVVELQAEQVARALWSDGMPMSSATGFRVDAVGNADDEPLGDLDEHPF